MIRELRKSDGPRIFEMLKVGFPEEEALVGTDPEGFERVMRRVFRWDMQFLLRLLKLFGRPTFQFFVIDEDGKVVATTILSFPENAGYVSMVMVDAAYRRRGYAQALVEHARVAAQRAGRKYMVLGVLSQNVPARALYEKIGYRPLHAGALLVREGPPPSGGTSPSVRPFQSRDANALEAVARRLTPPEVDEVLPVRASAIRGTRFADRVLESITAAWVIDRGHGPEAHLSATVGSVTRAGHLSNPIISGAVPVADVAALVSSAIDWCAAHGSSRLAAHVPQSNARGRAALVEGGFHEALTDWTLYRPIA